MARAPRTPPTANELLRDAMTRHQIGLMRLSGSVRGRVFALLRKTEADLQREVERKLGVLSEGAGVTPAAVRRMQALRTSVSSIRRAATRQVGDVWTEEMRALVAHEAQFVASSISASAPVLIDTLLPDASLLRTLVTHRPVEGKTLRGWAESIGRADVDRIMGQVQIGMVQGETIPQIARRVSSATDVTMQAAEAITRTSVNSFANAAKQEVYKANSDIISEEVYLATLDARTTPVCRSLDGKRFPLGEGPVPPLHFNCRSVRVAVIDGEVAGSRPMKPVTERGLLREYARDNDLDAVTSRDDLPRGHKGSFDEYARVRTRELVGTVPGAQSYGEFLGNQSREFQEDVLGRTKAKLFRDGELGLDRFVNRQGDELTLKQLAKREAAAFRKAGLNPGEFL